MQRSEMKELDGQKENISSSLMMMSSAPQIGSTPSTEASRKVIQESQDHRSSREILDGIEIALGSQQVFSHFKSLEDYQRGVNGHMKPQKKTVLMKVKSIISRLVTWLLRRKRSGA